MTTTAPITSEGLDDPREVLDFARRYDRLTFSLFRVLIMKPIWALFALAIGAFAIGTTEFTPMGLLPVIERIRADEG